MKLHPLPKRILQCGKHTLDLSRPQVMGILNVTPDSFSDGGRFNHLDTALKHAELMLDEGASIIDIGGESTRPNAAPVSVQEELDRVIPLVEALTQGFDPIISIDTSSPEVFSAAVDAGATIWNDVRALTRPNALDTAARLKLPVILMHMRGEPATMNDLAVYHDVTREVHTELSFRIEEAFAAGIMADNLIIDMGFGFAKDTPQSLQLLNEIWKLNTLELPMLMGISRKRVLGEILNGAAVDERIYAGLGAALLGVQQGVSIIRTHDVRATVEMLSVFSQLP
ncbi:dihydropteroate synthase [Aquirhabdus parva]|uniref:Dihydropteroate synthase n=1 Tax=Aquirhabdus parva TaxID=2283318 RepID=A0A345PA94_9GAMM|nr:dihydropteroate synthase [Aquirhabdus parva]AXI04203.1 dihydropteroate synthase [Aquirhabdus parva]